MSHKNKKTLSRQVYENLQKKQGLDVLDMTTKFWDLQTSTFTASTL